MKIKGCDFLEFLRKIPDDTADLVFTDPPYWTLDEHRKVGTTTRLKKQWFETIGPDEIYLAIEQFYRILKPNRHALVMCDGKTLKDVLTYGGLFFNYVKPLVWDKIAPGMGYHLRCQHEYVVLMDKGKNRVPKDLSATDIIRIKRVMRSEYPTEKPVELVEHFLNLYTEPGELVLDPFMGSGSTAVACKKLGRKFVGCDISTDAVELTKKRLASVE